MKKTIAILVILAAAGLCIQNIGSYENEYVVVAKNYVAKVPPMLSNPATIDNKYKISLVPRISFNEKAFTVSPSITEKTMENGKNRFTFKTETEQSNMKVTEEIHFEEDFIKTTATIRNIGPSVASASMLFNINAENGAFFFPSALDKNANNYIIITDQSLEGQSIGIVSSQAMDTSSEQLPIRNASTYVIGTRVPDLKPGQEITVSLVIVPFDLRKKEDRAYPLSAAAHLEEPLIKTVGAFSSEIRSVNTDKIDQVLETLN
ncbi:MAG: hypothetical protein QXO69_03750, partial [archaeon]